MFILSWIMLFLGAFLACVIIYGYGSSRDYIYNHPKLSVITLIFGLILYISGYIFVIIFG